MKKGNFTLSAAEIKTKKKKKDERRSNKNFNVYILKLIQQQMLWIQRKKKKWN